MGGRGGINSFSRCKSAEKAKGPVKLQFKSSAVIFFFPPPAPYGLLQLSGPFRVGR